MKDTVAWALLAFLLIAVFGHVASHVIMAYYPPTPIHCADCDNTPVAQ